MHHRAQSILGGSEALRESAASAFRAYVRAYAAQPAALKSVFYVKKLHLGRLAHSFGLKERPTVLGHSASKAALALKSSWALIQEKSFYIVKMALFGTFKSSVLLKRRMFSGEFVLAQHKP